MFIRFPLKTGVLEGRKHVAKVGACYKILISEFRTIADGSLLSGKIFG
jgi:hypothetical protein